MDEWVAVQQGMLFCVSADNKGTRGALEGLKIGEAN